MVVAIVAEEPHAPVLLLHVTVHRLPATSKEDSEWRAGRDGAVLARKVEEVEKEGQDGERDPAHIQPEAIGLERSGREKRRGTRTLLERRRHMAATRREMGLE